MHSQMFLNKHKCELYETYGGGYHYRVCATTDFINIPLQLITPQLAEVLPYGRQLEEMNLFPLLATKALVSTPDGGPPRRSKDGGVVEEVELTLRLAAEEHRPIPATEFELPNYPNRVAPVLGLTGEMKH